MSPLAERELLHRGRGDPPGSTWGSLGMWQVDGCDYASACAALARAVAQAAELAPGERVLSVACGGGDELLLWVEEFDAAQAVGVEMDRALVHAARGLATRVNPASRRRIAVMQGSGAELEALLQDAAPFDCLLCVDAAYHLRSRTAFLQSALRLLRPGGRLAYTDLVADTSSVWLRAAARVCGLPGSELQAANAQVLRLRAAGFEDVQLTRLDDAVLAGFARFVRRQERRLGRDAWCAAWRRPAVTARLIGPCRAAGLGYALLAARKPAPIASATT